MYSVHIIIWHKCVHLHFKQFYTFFVITIIDSIINTIINVTDLRYVFISDMDQKKDGNFLNIIYNS